MPKGLTCSRGLVGAVESSVSTRRRAGVHVEEDAVPQPEAATGCIWDEDGLFLTVCRLTSERKRQGEVQHETIGSETKPSPRRWNLSDPCVETVSFQLLISYQFDTNDPSIHMKLAVLRVRVSKQDLTMNKSLLLVTRAAAPAERTGIGPAPSD